MSHLRIGHIALERHRHTQFMKVGKNGFLIDAGMRSYHGGIIFILGRIADVYHYLAAQSLGEVHKLLSYESGVVVPLVVERTNEFHEL